jgi:AbrB family looped-hinge helix DNA binding protein
MKNLVPIDQAGRVVLPKSVREDLAIQPGDVLKIVVQGKSVTLTPEKQCGNFVRKGRAFVFTTAGDETLSAETVNELLAGEREEQANRAARVIKSNRG